MLIGITHTPTGEPILRIPRTTKVGIGLPKGRASYIYLHQGKWVIRYGAWENSKLVMKTVLQTKDRTEAEAYHAANKQNAATRNYPQKIPFFTFTRRSIVEEAGKPVEVFEPDFDAIEANGETPRVIDVVLMSDQPFSGEYQMWSATELKCHGDGVNGLRILGMGEPRDPGWLDAKERGQKYFPIGPEIATRGEDYTPCWTDGCEYAKDGGGCKPAGTLNFQLANAMRLGATAYFHTTGYRSISQIFSSLETIRMMAARAGSSLVGLPLKMVLAPYKTNHNGQAATQYGVSLELRAEDMKALRQRFLETSWAPRQIASAAPVVIDEDVAAPAMAASMAAEFYPEAVKDDEEDGEGAEGADAKPEVQVQTEKKTSELAAKLKKGAKGVMDVVADAAAKSEVIVKDAAVKAEPKPDPKPEPPKSTPPANGQSGDLF